MEQLSKVAYVQKETEVIELMDERLEGYTLISKGSDMLPKNTETAQINEVEYYYTMES